MLKAVGVALSLAVLCGLVVAVARGEFSVAVALAAIGGGVFGYRKLLQLERRIHRLEQRNSGDSSEPPETR
jgi:hypothetical protein